MEVKQFLILLHWSCNVANHCSCRTVSVDGDLLPQAGVAVVRLLHHRDELEVPVSLAEDQTDTRHDA